MDFKTVEILFILFISRPKDIKEFENESLTNLFNGLKFKILGSNSDQKILVPNLLLYGSSGNGKTSFAEILENSFFPFVYYFVFNF